MRTTQQLFSPLLAALIAAGLMAWWGSSPPVAARAEESAAVPAVLRARLIELVDSQGQPRASLKVEEDGEAVFRMRDATGAIRVKVSAGKDGSGLLLLDDRTEPAVHALGTRGGTTVTLTQKGKSALQLQPK